MSRVNTVLPGQGLLDDVRLVSGRRSVGPQSTRATFVELCSCPTGYVGQFCESCAAGYRRDPYGNGPFTRCIPCECNGHADYCDVDTGEITLKAPPFSFYLFFIFLFYCLVARLNFTFPHLSPPLILLFSLLSLLNLSSLLFLCNLYMYLYIMSLIHLI